ncbi:MAG: hypothetical protein NZ651_04380 [Candidatus Bipolaricaulota bacterium]|nr:hypothetical protein [Candidatus Bipolaricaulota bacterium]MDW8126988.1 hypothetical protein [Candidatus Bipolaricaulota bacterium]
MYEGQLKQDIAENPPALLDEEKKRGRPWGISTLAVLNVFGAMLTVAAALGLGVSGKGSGAAVALGLLGLGQFLVARGLWHLKNWARLTALVCYGISATIGLIALFTGNPSGLAQFLVAGAIAGYLCRAHVVEAFGG